MMKGVRGRDRLGLSQPGTTRLVEGRAGRGLVRSEPGDGAC